MSDNIKIKLSVLFMVYLAILLVTMVLTFIPITIWWLFTGYMFSNIIFIKISLVVTTIIFVVSSLIGVTSKNK
jgi:hypothetical protein